MYAVREERSERAGASESARDEIGFGSSESGSGPGKSVDKRWMRDRALEMDSHHECIGSLLLLLLVVVVVVVMAVVPLWFRWCWLPLRWLGFWEEEEVVEEEEGDPPGMWWRKSMVGSGSDSSLAMGGDGGHEERLSCPQGSELSYVA